MMKILRVLTIFFFVLSGISFVLFFVSVRFMESWSSVFLVASIALTLLGYWNIGNEEEYRPIAEYQTIEEYQAVFGYTPFFTRKRVLAWVLLFLGIAVIACLCVFDHIRSIQTAGPPYVYDYDPDARMWYELPTYYPERAEGWVKIFYSIPYLRGIGYVIGIALLIVGMRLNRKVIPKQPVY